MDDDFGILRMMDDQDLDFRFGFSGYGSSGFGSLDILRILGLDLDSDSARFVRILASIVM